MSAAPTGLVVSITAAVALASANDLTRPSEMFTRILPLVWAAAYPPPGLNRRMLYRANVTPV